MRVRVRVRARVRDRVGLLGHLRVDDGARRDIGRYMGRYVEIWGDIGRYHLRVDDGARRELVRLEQWARVDLPPLALHALLAGRYGEI